MEGLGSHQQGCHLPCTIPQILTPGTGVTAPTPFHRKANGGACLNTAEKEPEPGLTLLH